MSCTPTSGLYKYSSNPDLYVEQQEDENLIRNINIRKRKNSEQTQFLEMKDSLMQSFQEMMNCEINELKKQNLKIIESNNEILRQLQINAASYKEISDRVKSLETQNKSTLTRVSDLELQLHLIQKRLTKNMLEIRNVPKSDNENLGEVVKTICNVLQTPYMKDAVIYRKGKNNTAITVEIEHVKEREIFLKAFKKYNNEKKDDYLNTEVLGFSGVKSRVYISECLTPMAKKILAAGRELVKNGIFKYCWISRGNVLLRREEGQPALVINSIDRISELSST